MGPALPPPPPALVMTLDQAIRIAAGKGAGEPLTLGDVADAAVVVRAKLGAASRNPPAWKPPAWIGTKTKGKRDASLRSRANRRKA